MILLLYESIIEKVFVMKIKINKDLLIKYTYMVIAVCLMIVFYFIVQNINFLSKSVKDIGIWIFDAFKPFIIGFAIAYFLFRPVRYIERKILQFNYFKRHIRFTRIIAIIFVYCILIFSLYFFMDAIIPKVIYSIKAIFQKLPDILNETQLAINKFVNDNELISKLVENIDNDNTRSAINQLQSSAGIQSLLLDGMQDTGVAFSNIISITFKQMMIFSAMIFSIIISMFIGLYMLLDKESLMRQNTKFFRIILGKDRFIKITRLIKLIDEIFYKFFTGKLICSVIIGILYFIGLVILDVDHGMLISLIIAITNMIPIFGPIIGVIPGVIITLFYSPVKTIWLIILAVIVQQIDENILAPKVLGNIIGLNPFWILFSIIIGGELFGILGMIFAIPIFAIIRIFLVEWINAHQG